jgi:hypothetical protein
MVLRRADWHGKQETRTVPAYLARRPHPVRTAMVRLPRNAGYEGRPSWPLTGGAKG